MSPGDREALLSAIQARIKHSFADPALLDRALTHPSYAHEYGGAHNQRLEFLGDAVVGAIVGQACFERFPEDSDGDLSLRKHRLVSGATLADIGRALELHAVLRLGTGARRAQVNEQPKMIADATEALIGALVLDAGFGRTAEIVTAWFEPYFARHTDPEAPAEAPKSPISRLHEHCQRKPVRSKVHPLVLDRSGDAHQPVWTVGWWCGGELLASTSATSKQRAKEGAAELALERLQALLDQGWLPERGAEPPDDPSALLSSGLP